MFIFVPPIFSYMYRVYLYKIMYLCSFVLCGYKVLIMYIFSLFYSNNFAVFARPFSTCQTHLIKIYILPFLFSTTLIFLVNFFIYDLSLCINE